MLLKTQKLAKANVDDRDALVKAFKLTTATAPGIKEIKQVELYTKYRPLLPKEEGKALCPHPGDEIFEYLF